MSYNDRNLELVSRFPVNSSTELQYINRSTVFGAVNTFPIQSKSYPRFFIFYFSQGIDVLLSPKKCIHMGHTYDIRPTKTKSTDSSDV